MIQPCASEPVMQTSVFMSHDLC